MGSSLSDPGQETGAGATPGRFISIEGPDGAGKTTQIRFICSHLAACGISCVATREPGGTPMGEAIRELLLGRVDLAATPRSQLLLVFAARNQHLEEYILPTLASGKWMVCDRFTDATYAYQGGAGDVGFDAVASMENWVQGEFRPDLTLLLDIPVELGLARVSERGDATDRFEAMEVAARRRIRESYLRLAREHPERIVVVDASARLDEVSARIAQVLNSWFELAQHPTDGGAGDR